VGPARTTADRLRQRWLTLLVMLTIGLLLLTACGGAVHADGQRAETVQAPSDADVSSGAQSAEMVQRHDMILLLHTTTGRDGSALAVNVVDNTICPVIPLAAVQRVRARIMPVGHADAPVAVPLLRDPDGLYRARGAFMRTPGTWRIEVRVRRRDTWQETAWQT